MAMSFGALCQSHLDPTILPETNNLDDTTESHARWSRFRSAEDWEHQFEF